MEKKPSQPWISHLAPRLQYRLLSWLGVLVSGGFLLLFLLARTNPENLSWRWLLEFYKMPLGLLFLLEPLVWKSFNDGVVVFYIVAPWLSYGAYLLNLGLTLYFRSLWGFWLMLVLLCLLIGLSIWGWFEFFRTFPNQN